MIKVLEQVEIAQKLYGIYQTITSILNVNNSFVLLKKMD